jgi:hypothetical protein
MQPHLYFFPGNMKAVCDEHGERFHHVISRIGGRGGGEKRTVANGTQACWLTTAGQMYGRNQQKNTRDKRRQNEFLTVHLFIFIEYVVNR